MQYLHINLTSLFNTITYGSQLNTEHSTTQNKESVKFQTANEKEVQIYFTISTFRRSFWFFDDRNFLLWNNLLGLFRHLKDRNFFQSQMIIVKSLIQMNELKNHIYFFVIHIVKFCQTEVLCAHDACSCQGSQISSEEIKD